MKLAVWHILSITLACCVSASAMGQPLGDKPTYLKADLSSVANQNAIGTTIWAPGLDDGYVPQGLAHIDSTVLVASYKSVDPKVGSGPCRVFAVSTVTGKQTGYFDMPEDCGHAGGLVMIDTGTVIVSDTRMLYKIDLKRALEAKLALPALLSVAKLSGLVKGSFVDFDGKDIWVGSSEKTPEKARAYRLSLQIFKARGKTATINETMALSSIPIPTEANGLAFNQKGEMWIAASNSKFGALYRLNPSTGEVMGQHDVVIGIEDLSFDQQGNLWSVSEAGSRRWATWRQTFPVIFRLDVAKLK
jgi:outer membrane protein assembly factor BamB